MANPATTIPQYKKPRTLDVKKLKFEHTPIKKRRILGKTYVVASDWALRRHSRRGLRRRLDVLVGRISRVGSRRIFNHGL